MKIRLLSIIILIGGLGYVYYRETHPEWKTYRLKGIALAVEGLEKRVKTADDNEKAKLRDQISVLREKPPEIIEITPFGKLPPERCLTCHSGIEDISASHPNSVFGCVICHGGNGSALTKTEAHSGLHGGANPATLDLAQASCGSDKAGPGACHSGRHEMLNRAKNVPLSIMATNAGIIGILRFQWGIEPTSESRFGIKAAADRKTALKAIGPEKNGDVRQMAETHFRKFCAACHLWGDRKDGEYARRQGCPSCHGSYGADGYTGGDPTIPRNQPGRTALHTLTNLINNDRCKACHNRSARTALNYHGEMESSQYGTPYVAGGLSPQKADDRFVWRLTPDIHHEKKMACIDCHTAQDTMGDGKLHLVMKDQVEIRCEDCHGSFTRGPTATQASTHDPLIAALGKTARLREDDVILATSKGRPLPHIRLTEKGFVLKDKLTGKDHVCALITGKKGAHSIKGHERLECDSCHSAWSPQCFGCHQALDLRKDSKDHISGQVTRGRWSEGRGYFRYERNILGINSRGRVGILVPGCQVWNTVVDRDENPASHYDSAIIPLQNGRNSLAVGSTHPHTTRKEAPRCIDCHNDPKMLGLGEGNFGSSLSNEPTSTYDSDRSGLGIGFSQEAVIDPTGAVLQGTSHEKARGFNKVELDRIRGIVKCLACHDKYDDPIWAKPGPYKMTPKCEKALSEWATK
jgi:hypothetical protein